MLQTSSKNLCHAFIINICIHSKHLLKISGFSLPSRLLVSPSLSPQNLNPRAAGRRDPWSRAGCSAAVCPSSPRPRRCPQPSPCLPVFPETPTAPLSARLPCSAAVRRPLAHRWSAARLHGSPRTGWARRSFASATAANTTKAATHEHKEACANS
jgi:hypothetical protein